MYNNKVKDLQRCKGNESKKSTALGDKISFSYPYEFLWVIEHIEKEPRSLSKQDIKLLSDIGIPQTSLNNEHGY